MFTGIIQEIGTVVRAARTKGITRLTVQAPVTAARVQPLDSVAVSGTCLSVVMAGRGMLTFDVIEETRGRTSVGALRPGERVNLEPSLTLSDRLGGHLVFGHVDGTGTVVSRRQRGGELMLEIRVPAALRRFLVPKGPVAVDGISLTVGPRVSRSTFTIHLIPETLRQTTLRSATVGCRVNVEVDYFAKLIHQFLQTGTKH
jgi:riboflavin synthase alpha subunit